MSTEKLPPEGFELGPGWNVIRGDVPILCDEHGRYHARYCHEDAREVIDRAVCVVFAEAMGAIVRKAEAPTLPDQVHAFEPSRFGDYCGREVDGDYCKRGRAHEVHTVPAAAPAAPVGHVFIVGPEHIYHGPPPEELQARIAALEADLAKARKSRDEIAAIAVKQHAATVAGVQATKRVAELEAEVSHLKYTAATDLESMKTNAAVGERLGVGLAARIVERDGWMEAAAKSESEKAALVSAAVQAERERCAATMDEWLANRLTLVDCRQRVGDGTPIKNGDPAP